MFKHKLLLADDSITIQKVVNLTFADEGIEVVAVGDGDSALLKISEAAPDLIMADVNMPGQNGYQICESVKQNAALKNIPVILLVGSFEPFDEDEARRVGADDFMTKPFQSIRQLVGKVTELLNRENNAPAPTEEADSEMHDTLEINQPSTLPEQFREAIPVYSQINYDDEMIQTDHVFPDTTAETAKLYPIESSETGNFESNSSSPTLKINTVSDFEAESDAEFSNYQSEFTEPQSNENFPFNPKSVENGQTAADRFDDSNESPKVYDFAEDHAQEIEEMPEEPDARQEVSDYFSEDTAAGRENASSQIKNEEISAPPSALKINFDEFDLLELPPLPVSAAAAAAASEPEVVDDTEQVGQFAETMKSEIKAETAGSEDAGKISHEAIEAIAQRVFEKLSEKFFDKNS